MKYSFNGNKLVVNGQSVIFPYNIGDVKISGECLIVLLSIPIGIDNEVDNLYSVDKNGHIIWQAQPKKTMFPSRLLYPYEGMLIENDMIIAIDFYARRYFIDIRNGNILKQDTVK